MELRDYLNVISARRWVIIQAIVVVTLTTIVTSLLIPKQYSGEATLLISERDVSSAVLGTDLSEFSSAERGLQTQVQLMKLRPLAESTIRALSLDMTPSALLASLKVSAVGQTNVVTIQVTADDPETASNIANAMAEEYVTWSRDMKRESIQSAADEVDIRLAQAEQRILALSKEVASRGRDDELGAEMALLTSTYSTLADKLEQLRINEQLETGTGRVVSPAVPNSMPVTPRVAKNVLLGALVGMLLGLGMAFLYEYLDNTIKSSDEVERIFAAPVLGTIPLERFNKDVVRRLTIVESPGSPAAEAYRVLRNSLDFINFEHKMKTLLISSATPAEGKSTVAANLAASLAQTGKRVVLMSCDFRRPTTQQFFSVNNAIGLSDVLLGSHTLKAALQRPGEEQLLVLTSGKMPPNPSELLGSAKMQSLIGELEDWADWVIIDSPPLLFVADSAAVARWTDGVLMVMQGGQSTREASKKAVESLSMVGAAIVGVVVWGFEESKSAGYGYYIGGSHYYSQHSLGHDATAGAKTSIISPGSGAWEEQKSTGWLVASVLGRLAVGTLGFMVVAVLLLAIVYILAQYAGWDLRSFYEVVSGMWPLS